MSEENYGLLENIAGISAEFHTNKLYDKFYDLYADHFNGFVGIYGYVIQMAKALAKLENSKPDFWDNNGKDWVEGIEDYTAVVIKSAVENKSLPDLDAILESSVITPLNKSKTNG